MTDKVHHHGRFVWRELMTPDVDASKAFYGEVFNWKLSDVDMGPFTYTMLQAAGRDQGGMMPIQQPGMPPHWRAFVSVDDVDAAAKTGEANGGKVVFGPETMGPGRIALLLDPAGANVALWHATDGDKPLADEQQTGEFCWEDLMTPDAGKVSPFYKALFGWDTEAFPGTDSITVLKVGDAMAGGINTNLPAGVPSHWLSYVVVDSLAEATKRAVGLEGKAMVENVEIGDYGRISVIQDNVGATIGLFEKKA